MQASKINVLKALHDLITDKCESCGLRPKTTEKKWCSRCIAVYYRKQEITPARILSYIETDYLSADIKDFSAVKDELLRYNKNNLFLLGQAGTGKTRAIFALLKIALAEGYAAERHEFTALCSMIRDTFNKKDSKETENGIIKRLAGLDVLFIDDLGISNEVSDFDYEVLYRIVDTRLMACLPTAIASNKSIEQIGQIYDKRIESRLQTYQVILFTGQDKRENLKK
jgi:DNA replication protein DnaC